MRFRFVATFALFSALFGLSALAAQLPAIDTSAADPVLPAGFAITKVPYSAGIRATADLPASQHHQNTGGMGRGGPGTGAGLCVYTSTWHSALWQSVSELYDFRDWMKSQPGGSYPDKFDETLKQFCASKGIPAPGYVQHTGGDMEFLDLAIKTGRMPGITYCGMDGRYKDRSGKDEVIAHMVSLVYLDTVTAAILDNNYPGTWLWMPRAALQSRWTGIQANGQPYYGRDGRGRQQAIGGGWTIVLLPGPPPPYSSQPAVQLSKGSECPCEGDCHCEPGSCPAKCPVQKRSEGEPAGSASGSLAIGQLRPFRQAAPGGCPGGVCPLPQSRPDPLGGIPKGKWIESTTPGVYGYWVGDRCAARLEPDGKCYACDDRGYATTTEIIPPAPLPTPPAIGSVNSFPVGGVDSSKLVGGEHRFWCQGASCTKEEALAALTGSLTDDSGRWNLAVVGTPNFWRTVTDDVGKLDPAIRAKLNLKVYAPGDWQVSQFGLSEGLTLRKPAANRVGGDVGSLTTTGYMPSALTDLLGKPGGPIPASVPVPVMPAPVMPGPVAPVTPAPVPVPEPTPGEISGLDEGMELVLFIALFIVGCVIYRRY